MRNGFTTGSCAAAAALASCLWRRTGECPERVEIRLPGGEVFTPEILAHAPYVCGVIKDAGDDPDVTNGHEILAEYEPGPEPLQFLAGEGVGVVTEPGLALPVGEAAINPVPRQMIRDAVGCVYPDGGRVTIGIQGGRELAEKTFNPRLGIRGGLSVLGTTGIVRPMSQEALKDTIALELRVRREKTDRIGLCFGRTGEEHLQAAFPGILTAQISNEVGFAMDEAAALGYAEVLLGGHPGKLVKVSAGVMQTHSRTADARREPVLAMLALRGAPHSLLQAVDGCLTTNAIMDRIAGSGYEYVWDDLAERAAQALRARAGISAEAVFVTEHGILGQSKGVGRWIT